MKSAVIFLFFPFILFAETMDVKIDNSSKGIEVQHIDTRLSDKALGSIKTQNNLTNTYIVTYSFPEGLLINGSTIWLLGKPNSSLIIRFPDKTTITSTSGIDNVTVQQGGIYGTFGGDFNKNNNQSEVEITYLMSPKPSINLTKPEENETIPLTIAPTEIPFLGIGSLLLIVITVVVLRLEDQI